jgi:CDP-diacylglycerol--glycerol-3-phosphate 3-phosphatidyltransferase
LSDILDGVLARAFQLNSELGALLDSTADMLTTLCALFGIWRFERAFVTEHAAPLLLILTLYVGEGIAAFFRYGRISSFHTILARVAAYLQGIFIMCLFLWGYSDWVFTPMVLLSVISLTEELILLALLREWRPDVRGLWWLLRA